jgi:ATP-dependent RNA helicase DDX5/DBP2
MLTLYFFVHTFPSPVPSPHRCIMAAAEGKAWQEEHNLTVIGDDCPMPMTTFAAATMFPAEVHATFKTLKFDRPTVIQAQSWPILLQKRDLVGIAKTGSGKTLAFLLPAILQIQSEKKVKPGDGPVCLVLAPTRELAQQIEVEAQRVVPNGMKCAVVYGGAPKYQQAQLLDQGVSIVVGTTGRLLDLLNDGNLKLNRVTFLVLDEADRMLDLGFEPDVRKICKLVCPTRQTVMFSATWPETVQALASSFQTNPIRIHVGSTDLHANSDVTQNFIFVRQERDKYRELTTLLNKYWGKRVLIFGLYKKSVNFLEQSLKAEYGAFAIHSDKTQQQREANLERFKTTEGAIMIATDVAARGLDVKQLEVVINYEFPLLSDDYIHRIGRTGRAGSKGQAFTILCDVEPYFDHFAARDVVNTLKAVGQPVPAQLAALAAKAGQQVKGNRKPASEKVPDAPSLSAHAPKASIKFDDSDDEDAAPVKKKGRTE